MTIAPAPPAPHGHRSRTASILALTGVAALGGTAWYLGLFASHGRFAEVDACTLLPPPATLAPLVPNGAREPADSRPKTLLGLGGDLSSECKWSSVPAGRDGPFRTVRIHAKTMVHETHTSAETMARHALAASYRSDAGHQGARTEQIDVGAQGYRTTDMMTVQIVFSRTVIYDLHVKFRISNAVVDVSARTHTAPTDGDMALVLGLAKDVAERLDSTH